MREDVQERASPLSPAAVAETLERGPQIVRDFEDQRGSGSTVLAEPACQQGCRVCFMECAVRGIHARLWAERLVKAKIAQREALTHNGVMYVEMAGQA